MFGFCLRWAFLFLILINAVVFLWYSLQQKGVDVDRLFKSEMERILLLSEISTEQLAALEIAPLSARTAQCYEVIEIKQKAVADQLMAFLQQLDLSREQGQEEVLVKTGYEVLSVAPESQKERLAFLSILDELEIVPESREGEGGRLEFVLLRTDQERLAVGSISLWSELLPELELHRLMRRDIQYRVDFSIPTGHKLSNEISFIVKKAFPAIKVSKKHCDGVAKGATDH